MRALFHTLLITGALLLAPVDASAEPLTLESAQSTFQHSKAEGNTVCFLLDGWQIALLSADGQKIGAAIIMEQEDAEDHESDMSDVISRLAELAGMGTPESIEFEEEDYECALLVDQDVLGELAEETDDTFSGSPLAALSYLLADEYFCLHNIRRNGYIHWKTVKKSGVDLLMPMADKKLAAIEVTGRQQMNEFAAEVLADKLGLGKNTVPAASREALCPQLRCVAVPYMNAKSGVLLARTDRRTVIGRQPAVVRMLANRNEAALTYPDEAAEWPEEEEEEETEAEEEEEKDKPLTPETAREAYIKYIQGL